MPAAQLVAFAMWLVVLALPAVAGELSRTQLESCFVPPLRVQEKLADLPAWPLTSDQDPGMGPIGYVFESIDLAPLPGFAGTPINLLVAVDRDGNFMNVEVLSQREPIFLDVLDKQLLREFVTQYAGKSLKREITIASGQQTELLQVASGRVTLDGITRATTSVRILNQTALGSALAVARAKLGFADRHERAPARPRSDVIERLNFDELLKRGMIARLRVRNDEAERIFSATDGAGADSEALSHPSGTFVDLYVAYLNAPTVGRSVLGDDAYEKLTQKLQDGRHALWIATAGRYSMLDDNFTPAGVPQRLALSQDGLPIELRDLVFELPSLAGAPELNASRVFTVYAGAGLDPGRTMELTLTLTRSTTKGLILPRIIQQPATLKYPPPRELFDYPPEPLPEWLQAWKARWVDLVIIAAAFLALSLVLCRPHWMAVRKQRLAAFRLIFLAFTLIYLGWYAQGQLSIVQVTGILRSLISGQGLGSLLYDPVLLLVIAITAATLLIWGRGTFCGWLCPFGALQEMVGAIARRMRLPRTNLPAPLVRWLERLRYVVLAIVVVSSLAAPSIAESLAEVEPFKTAITVGFDRSWPFVAYAVLLLLAGAFYFKFFCRFVCPLGAAMTIGGKLRAITWLPRREVCGRPCQTCRSRCAYNAIEADGTVRYDDCFQCLDCVGIYHDSERCAPIVLYRRKGLVMTPAGVLQGTKIPL